MGITPYFILLFIPLTVCADRAEDKLFLTDLADSAIYVGDNSGPSFFSSSFQRLNVSGVEDPVGVDYDYRNEMVYWTDEGRGIISRAKLDGSMQEVLVDDFEGVGYPEGIVLDLEDERMIWTDTLLEKIESANLDGSSRKTIINTGLYLPWSITLSYKRKMLYWTEHGDWWLIGAKIEMATKYGFNRRVLVSTNISQPNGLALDSQGDKIFLTDPADSAIYVGDSSGPNFFSSSFQKLPVSGVEDPIGVDYDYRNEMVYWTDESRGIISRAKLDGSMQEVLVDEFEGVGYPEGLVLDLEDERMIWTDTLLEKIESANLDGSSRNTIIFTGLYLPWSITLSYKRKMLYWTEHGDGVYIGAKIEMATKYGFNRRVLVSTNISQPNGLALDSQEQRLYWTEGFYDVIESIDLDTLERQVHVNTESGGAFVWGISLYFDSIYFTELGSAMLYEADLGEEEIRIVSVHAFPVHVKIYANLTCPDPISCEGNSACELIGYDTPSCTCLPGYTGPTCLDEITCPLPSNENPSTHFVDPSPIYYNGQALVEVCDNGNDERTHVCNGFTGEWYTTTLIYCTEYGAKIFLTDPADSAIYVGDSSGPNFFSSSFQKLNVSGAEGPVGVDYDYRNEMVYWTDEGRGIISRAKLDGSMQEVLVDVFEGVGYPEGLVLDLEDERMIWTDTLLEKIESANLDGSSRNTIINTGLYLPWSITLSYKRK
nr:low-density lipoprotein receptor-related protein 4-like [Lytechinus pictus]